MRLKLEREVTIKKLWVFLKGKNSLDFLFFFYFEYPLVFSDKRNACPHKQKLYKLVPDCKQSNTDGKKAQGKVTKRNELTKVTVNHFYSLYQGQLDW